MMKNFHGRVKVFTENEDIYPFKTVVPEDIRAHWMVMSFVGARNCLQYVTGIILIR